MSFFSYAFAHSVHQNVQYLHEYSLRSIRESQPKLDFHDATMVEWTMYIDQILDRYSNSPAHAR